MKLISAALGNNRKPVKTAKGPRYQVRWYVDVGGGRFKEKKLTSFLTVGEAKLFIEQLRKADFAVDDWHFTPDALPSNDVVSPTSVLDAVESYFKTRWDSEWSDNQRTKVRGRFLTFVCVTLNQTRDQALLRQAFESQRKDRGVRPDPTSPAEWAGRWLRDCALLPNSDELVDPNLIKGRDWVTSRSLSVSQLDLAAVTRVKSTFTLGYSPNTARTYWTSTIMPFLTWLEETNLVERNPASGQTKIARDANSERPDPRRIPMPAQVAEMAERFGAAHGGNWDLLILLGSYCALRIGEALALQTNSFYRRPDGRLVVEITAQEKRVVGSSNDDGKTRVRTGTKARKNHTPPPRRIPIPAQLEAQLVERFGGELGTGDRPLFVGPRGAVGNYDSVREWWTLLIDEMFPEGHRLAGITPHSMRHAGMTWWFGARYDEALIQKWGGWQSLKVMLDTYRGVLDDPDAVDLSAMDKFEATSLGEQPQSDGPPLPSETVETGMPMIETTATIFDFDAERRKRLA